MSSPAVISLRIGCSLNWQLVTTPKFPPPPRTAQKRSEFSVSRARRNLPSAVTRSTDRRSSSVMPCLRVSHANPPPSVSPAIPAAEVMPVGSTSPWRSLLVDVSEGRAGFDPRSGCRSVDPNRLHERQIKQERALGNRVARDLRAAAADRDRQVLLAGKRDRGTDIGRAARAPRVPACGRPSRFTRCAPHRSPARPEGRRSHGDWHEGPQRLRRKW